MRKLALISLLIFLASSTYCQASKDRVILKNGKKIEGNIIEQRPGESIRIVAQNNIPDTLLFTMDEIEVIQKIENPPAQSTNSDSPDVKLTKNSNSKTPTDRNVQHYSRSTRFSINARFASEGSSIFPDAIYNSFLVGVAIHRTFGSGFEIGPRLDFGPVDEYPTLIENLVIEPKLDMRYRIGAASNWLEYSLVGNIGATIFKEKSGFTTDGQEFLLDTGLNYSIGIGLKFNIIGNTGITLDLGYASTRRKFNKLDNGVGINDNGGGLFIQTSLYF